jgi:Uma2 family endonuclease
MVIETQRLTMEEFKAFIALPDNDGRFFEFINGEVIEVSPGRTRYSEIAHIIAFAVRLFCQEGNIPCYTSGEGGAYGLDGQVVAPDFAYKPTPMSEDDPDPEPPLWVVEIISPTDKAADIRAKRQIYFQAEILYWELYPLQKSIDVYVPGQAMQVFGLADTLDGGDVLPGFTLTVASLFGDA